MKATVAERGQVTIPKPLREKLGIRPGTRLDFRDRDGKLVGEKVAVKDTVDAVYGCLGRGLSTDALMKRLRGAVATSELPRRRKRA